MTKMNLYAIPDATLTGCAGNFSKQDDTENPVNGPLQQCFLELAEVTQALATSQQQLKASQLHIETLLGNKTCLRQKLIRLAKKYAHARHFGYHDELTGLPNRSLLLDRLKQAMAQSDRQHKQVALLFIDLDKFKSVNDKLGHAVGDRLLQQVAER